MVFIFITINQDVINLTKSTYVTLSSASNSTEQEHTKP